MHFHAFVCPSILAFRNLLIRVIGWIPISLLFVSQVQRVYSAPQFSTRCHHQSLQRPFSYLYCFTLVKLFVLVFLNTHSHSSSGASCNMFGMVLDHLRHGVSCMPFTLMKMVLDCKSLISPVFTQCYILELYPHCCISLMMGV